MGDQEEPLLDERSKGWTAGLSFFNRSTTGSSTSSNEGKIIKSQSWLVPPEATQVPILDQKNRQESISEELLMRRITSDDISRDSTNSPISRARKDNKNEDSTKYDQRFILDSLRLEFVNDSKVERLFRERFFSIQTGHRHWSAFWQAVGEIFTNMTVSLICIEIVILILVMCFYSTNESRVPYLQQVTNCTSSVSSSSGAMQECFVVRYFDQVVGYVTTHGIVVCLLFVLIAIAKIKRLRDIMQARGAMLWQIIAPLILTTSAFVCLYGHFVAFRKKDPSYDDDNILPVPMVTMDFLVQFYSILLVLSCNSGILFWRVLWANLACSIAMMGFQFFGDQWLNQSVNRNEQGSMAMHMWLLINSFLTVLSYRNELQLRIAFIQTKRLEESNMEVAVQMKSLENPFTVARIQEYVGMRSQRVTTDNNNEEDLNAADDVMSASSRSASGLKLMLMEGVGDWALEYDRLRFDGKIARGGGGIVWKGRYFQQKVAIKQVFAGRNSKNSILGGSLEQFANEVSVLHRLNSGASHPNLLRLYGICKNDTNDLFFVMEFCDCSVHDILIGATRAMFGIRKSSSGGDYSSKNQEEEEEEKENEQSKIDNTMLECGLHSNTALKTLRNCIVQTANAMSFLHERNIAHRDLKPQNLLVKRYRTDNVQIKLADFGISRRGKESGMTLFAGTTAFIPPEILDPEAMFGGPGLDSDFRLERPEKSKRRQQGITLDGAMKADVWSFGVTCAAMCLESDPWPTNMACMTLIRKICQGLRPKLPSNCPSDIADLIRSCMQTDPYRRPDFRELEMKRCGFSSSAITPLE